MYLTKKIKEDIFKKHGKKAENTGSTEGQIALFTFRINHLTEHLKKNKKDFNTERSLVKLVGKRRALLDYLTKKDILTDLNKSIENIGFEKKSSYLSKVKVLSISTIDICVLKLVIIMTSIGAAIAIIIKINAGDSKV